MKDQFDQLRQSSSEGHSREDGNLVISNGKIVDEGFILNLNQVERKK